MSLEALDVLMCLLCANPRQSLQEVTAGKDAHLQQQASTRFCQHIFDTEKMTPSDPNLAAGIMWISSMYLCQMWHYVSNRQSYRWSYRWRKASYLQKHLMREPNEAGVSVLGQVRSHNLLPLSRLVHLEEDLHIPPCLR